MWSFTPSRMGIITSRRAWSKPSLVGSNFSGISLGRSAYVAGRSRLVLGRGRPGQRGQGEDELAQARVPTTGLLFGCLMDELLRMIRKV